MKQAESQKRPTEVLPPIPPPKPRDPEMQHRIDAWSKDLPSSILKRLNEATLKGNVPT